VTGVTNNVAHEFEKLQDPLRRFLEEALMEAHSVAVLDEGSGRGLRHFDASERASMTPAACGYLLELCRNSQITRSQMELLIHYASVLDPGPLDRGELAELVDNFIFSFPGRGSAPRAPHGGEALN